MSSKRSIVIRTVLALLLLIIGIGAIWMYWVYKHPLEAQARKMRRSLDTQGLERVETELSGRRSVYWVGGEGPLLVLLHGAGHQAGAWAPIVTPLLQEYRLLIPDLPGHGDSEPGSGPLAFDEVYSGLEALLASFADQPPPVLLGNSMGAWLSMFYAYDHPEAVDRVVAVNGGPITGDPSNPSLVPADREAARELMAMLRDPSSPAIPDFVLDDIVRRTASGPIGRLLQAPMSFAPFLLDGHLGELTV
ncbi:MAG: alpha/beta hydrolase, partial [Acidobacteriota bacterium]